MINYFDSSYKQLKRKLSENWLDKKKFELKSFLDNVFFNEVTENFAKSMRSNDKLAQCKSLDAIHIATALNIRKSNDVTICSFDKNMLKIAKELGFETNGI